MVLEGALRKCVPDEVGLVRILDQEFEAVCLNTQHSL